MVKQSSNITKNTLNILLNYVNFILCCWSCKKIYVFLTLRWCADNSDGVAEDIYKLLSLYNCVLSKHSPKKRSNEWNKCGRTPANE